MSATTTFHFTLGPVQGFVAQARRTRDFWAGSFLLSWLAGVAMLAVRAQGGDIRFPNPAEDYLAWLQGKGKGDPPRQGCIPNRFKAIRAEVDPNFNPQQVEQSVRTAWTALAEAVWHQDLGKLELDSDSTQTRAIWERQIEAFWEITWVLGEADDLLDRRKNWRSHWSPEEAGVKCSIMAGWQELSGAHDPSRDPRLKAFWEPLHKQHERDFEADEQLCAIAFVKRRFVRCFKALQVPMPDGSTLHGWEVDPQVPSTLDFAVANWVSEAVTHNPAEAWNAVTTAASDLFKPQDCGLGKLRCIKDACALPKEQSPINSSALFEHSLDNPALCPARGKVAKLKKAIKGLQHQALPAPFYAVLLMDGDRLGALLRDHKPEAISAALEHFTQAVPGLVDTYNGFLVYAGGDDVLALLPLADALACATAIRQCYLDAMQQALGVTPSPSTLSAAVQFAHVKIPLTRILRDAHDLLDNLAKDRTGRDALAVRVWKPSGRALQWSRPWAKALQGDGQQQRLILERLAEDFTRQDLASGDSTERAAFSSKFFYKIRERFALLNPDAPAHSAKSVFTPDEMQALLAADYLASGVNAKRAKANKLTQTQAEQLIAPLLDQCRPVTRGLDKAQIAYFQSDHLEADGALLVRFLAQKGADT